MKKVFISLLGASGLDFRNRDEVTEASYYFNKSLQKKFGDLKKQMYPNMFPLVLDNFKDYKHICIFTEMSKSIQQKVLAHEKIDFEIELNGIFISNDKSNDYSYFLQQLNKVMGDYDRVIVDVSHGFRHMPILSIFSLFNQNVRNQEKIEHILFSKEIVQFKKYEINDLKENFEIINFSFMLSSFNNNYSVPQNSQFTNIHYRELAYKLNKFSEYFTSNLKQLLDEQLIDNIIIDAKNILDIYEEDLYSDISILIDKLEYIRSLRDKSEWVRYYEFSKLMSSINNQLNAVMFLYDAMDFYCLDSLKKIDIVFKDIQIYENKIIKYNNPRYSFYTLLQNIRALIKLGEMYRYSSFSPYTQKTVEFLNDYLGKIEKINEFRDLIKQIEILRNSMVHSSITSINIFSIKHKYLKLLHWFEFFCIKEDILSPESLNQQNTYLHAIKIKNYFSISDMEIEDLKDKKEIYFVGENGDGKTILLQAIALALKGDKYEILAEDYIKNIKSDMELSTIDSKFPNEYKKYKNVTNLFAYGINRNKISNNEEDTKVTSYSGLFDTPSIYKTTLLRDAESFLEQDIQLVDKFKEQMRFLMDKNFEITWMDNGKLKYGEIEHFTMLSEGYKTTLIWLSDLLSRMMENQPEITELEEFQAIVLIDEVDLYLHPKWKYDFMNKLRKIFPKIQFIMTTHSLITILGASEDAVFYKVYKENGKTKITEQIDDISYYTSDILMTSPLFNLQTIKSRQFDQREQVSSDDYIYYRIHKKIKERLNETPSATDEDVDSWLDNAFDEEFGEE